MKKKKRNEGAALSAREHKRREFAKLRRPGVHLNVLTEAKTVFPPSDFDDLVAFIEDSEDVKKRIFPLSYLSTLTRLQRFRAPEPASLAREIAWSAAILVRHTPLLSRFVEYQSHFLECALGDEPQTAISILDAADADIGISLWSATARVAGLQIAHGLEAQKAYIRAVRKSAPLKNVAAYILYHTSVRNEHTVTLERFRADLQRTALMKQPRTTTLPYVLEYYLFGEVPPDTIAMSRLLAAGTAGSVVDHYEILLDCARRAYAMRLPEIVQFSQALGRIADVDDERLCAVRFALDTSITASETNPQRTKHIRQPEARISEVERAATTYAAVLSGRLDARTTAGADYTAHPSRVELFEPTLNSLPASPTQDSAPLRARTSSRLSTLLTGVGNSMEAADWLTKTGLNLRSPAWLAGLMAYITWSQSNAVDRPSTNETAFHLAFINQHIPWVAKFARNDAISAYRAAASLLSISSDMLLLFEAIDDPNRTINPPNGSSINEANFFDAINSYRARNLSQAITTASEAVTSPNPMLRAKAIQITAWALLQSNRLRECIRFMSTILINDISFATLMPVREVADLLTPDLRAELADEISTSVLLEQASTVFGQRYDVARKDAFEDYFRALGAARPSELVAVATETDQVKLIYYLRYIAVPSVLETSAIAFSGESAVVNERLAICTQLVSLDNLHADFYVDEIKRLIRERTIARRVREVDQSKVYVDVEGVKQIARERLRETYTRYTDFLRAGLGVGANQPEDGVFEAAMTRIRAGDIAAINSLDLPESEPASLLTLMVQEVADLYFISPTVGLERYLSARIRHGTLAGHLRAPLSAAFLVTERNEATNTYACNTHWPNQLQLAGTSAEIVLSDRLAIFSRAADTFIENDLRNWIRAARVDSDERAAFRYEIRPGFVRLVAETINPSLSLAAFIDVIVAGMRNALDAMLIDVGPTFAFRAKSRLTELLVDLQLDTHKICLRGEKDPSLLDAAIGSARTDVQHAIDRARNWFRMAPSHSSEPFTLELAVDVALRSVQALSPSFIAEVHSLGEPLEWRDESARLLPTVVDVLFPLLQNAASYRKVATPLTTTIQIDHRDGFARVQIASPLDLQRSGDDLHRAVYNFREAIESGRHLESGAKEGGTGLQKAYSSLAMLMPEPDLTFGPSPSHDTFRVEFSISPIIFPK